MSPPGNKALLIMNQDHGELICALSGPYNLDLGGEVFIWGSD